MRTMTLGAMLVVSDGQAASAIALVRCDARAFVQNLDGSGCGTNLDQLMHQIVWNAVEVGIEGYVVVDVDAGARPLAQIEGLGRQWFQSRFIDGLEYGCTAS